MDLECGKCGNQWEILQPILLHDNDNGMVWNFKCPRCLTVWRIHIKYIEEE